MENKWLELSYNLFPSFETQFDRSAYEECEDIYREEIDNEDETEENECLD